MDTIKTFPRITKAMKFDALAAVLRGEPIPNGLTTDDLLDFIEAEKVLLAKKNAGEKKPTKVQIENEGFRSLLTEFLAVQDHPVTCTDIQKGVPEFVDFNNQKIVGILRPLVQSGVVVKSTMKGRSMFSLA